MDNDISILLKLSKKLGVPSKFVDLEKGANIINDINSLIPTGESLNKLYEFFTKIQPEDLIIIYARKVGVTKETLLKINAFNDTLKLPPIRDSAELNILVREWEKKYVDEYNNDMQKLENIEIIQEELDKNDFLDFSPINVDSTIIVAEMVLKNGETPTVDNGYEIFDMAIPNKELPYIRWNNSSGKEVIKLYTGKTLEERPDYSKVIPGGKELTNSINFSLAKGEKSALKGVKKMF
jgi:hypothetical protein